MSSIIDGSTASPGEILTDLYWTGVRAAEPGSALTKALRNDPQPSGKVWILALGKAARPMASAALTHLQGLGTEPAGGLIVGPDAGSDLPPLESFVGNHPLPGPGSFAAAQAITGLTRWVDHDDEAWVLLSGGASSLIAAPVHPVSQKDLIDLYALLLTSGLDIVRMNTIRKRFSMWGAGGLARALAPARIRTFIVSDVVGEDIPTIGSGPCAPDEFHARDVRLLLEESRLWTRVPQSVRNYLAGVEAGVTPETATRKHPAFAKVKNQIVASNSVLLEAVADHARALGLSATLHPEPLTAHAAQTGEIIAERVLRQEPGTCEIWGGETVVRIEGPSGVGGRCQELALAASRVLSGRSGVAILAAGSDGRDGPTDAAGAMADGLTWDKIQKAGRDPASDLANHDSLNALKAAAALLRTGPTGTNVMDLVIGLSLPESSEARMS